MGAGEGDNSCVMKPYSGLKDVLNFYAKFVYVYETDIQYIEREKDFIAKYQKAFYVYKHEFKSIVKEAKQKDLIDIPDNTKGKLFYTKQKTLVLDLCRHFRNSFVHALMVRDGKEIIIKDKNRQFYTCKGSLKIMSVRDFISEIVKTYES